MVDRQVWFHVNGSSPIHLSFCRSSFSQPGTGARLLDGDRFEEPVLLRLSTQFDGRKENPFHAGREALSETASAISARLQPERAGISRPARVH
ncbi:hypothetical protein B8V81_0774 [Paenibacillus pasadenensis]|uniref:Uncharacterized protein n=1 Tax=Paenibacillus pasadenensis TaxID=217090 RepID=A0A2N5NBY0_9BACL|nr:hypothetical protein B8V81_0774 [Paenibacillus pasadenensis]